METPISPGTTMEGSPSSAGTTTGALDAVTDKVGDVAGKAQDSALGFADEKKGQLVSRARSATGDIHDAADALRSSGHADMARTVEQLSSRLEEVIGRVERMPASELVSTITTRVQGSPLLLGLSMFAVGFAASRAARPAAQAATQVVQEGVHQVQEAAGLGTAADTSSDSLGYDGGSSRLATGTPLGVGNGYTADDFSRGV